MNLLLIGFGVYSLGCMLTMGFFLVARWPALDERRWQWPVIFLWPALVFWPVHFLAGFYIKRKTRKEN
jgi:hypothetical protein